MKKTTKTNEANLDARHKALYAIDRGVFEDLRCYLHSAGCSKTPSDFDKYIDMSEALLKVVKDRLTELRTL